MTPALPGIEAKHPAEPPRSLALRATFEISDKRDGIAALVAGLRSQTNGRSER
jgi:hypothetical protein